MEQAKLGIILVAYGNGEDIRYLLDIIKKEKRPGDKIVLIDNHPDHATAAIAEKHKVVDITIRSTNVGFAEGCNVAAKEVENEVDLLFFLNPDCKPEAGAITQLREAGRPEWAAWMGLLVLDDGRKVNTAGNVVHISGLSWVTGFGDNPRKYQEIKEVDVASGADLVVRVRAWKLIKGFPTTYFMYYEDTELSFAIRMLKQKVGLVPGAKIRHDYSFYNGPHKWLYLERNRYLFIARAWPLGVIVVLLPLLLSVEIGLWLVSIMQRRFWLKVRSTIMAINALPEALKGRRLIQKRNLLSSYEFLGLLRYKIDTPLLSPALRSGPVNSVFTGYYYIARLILKPFS
jgi:GT2 family glycosyltransferase